MTRHTPINWDELPLGKVTDTQLSNQLGVLYTTVSMARRRRGISVHKEPTTNICQQCNTVKADDKFVSKRQDTNRHKTCSDCRIAKRRTYNKHKWKNKQHRNRAYQYAKLYRALHGCSGPTERTTIAYVIKAKDRPCMDCGGRFPAECMDFDRRDETVKLFVLSSVAARHKPLVDIDAEMAKCDLICSNCHRIRTKRRLHAKLAITRATLVEEALNGKYSRLPGFVRQAIGLGKP